MKTDDPGKTYHCISKDSAGNHCPEPATIDIGDGEFICEKCAARLAEPKKREYLWDWTYIHDKPHSIINIIKTAL